MALHEAKNASKVQALSGKKKSKHHKKVDADEADGADEEAEVTAKEVKKEIKDTAENDKDGENG